MVHGTSQPCEASKSSSSVINRQLEWDSVQHTIPFLRIETMSFLFAPQPQAVLPIDGLVNTYFPIHRVYGIARNYSNEKVVSKEKGSPILFQKPADAVIYAPEGETLQLAFPMSTENLQHEIELVVAIGKAGKNIPVEEAMQYVWGYAVGLDLNRRDLFINGHPWDAVKGFDESAPMSALKPISRVPDNEPMALWLYVNHEKRQEGSTGQMIFTVPEIISVLSSLYELKPGDLIMTGTPAGIGKIDRGDILEGGVQGVGVIKVKFGE